jgi:hypothetical protein
MISTFNFRAYLSFFLMMVILTAIIIIELEVLIEHRPGILMVSIFNAVVFLHIAYEFRNKIICVIVANDHIRKSSYFAQDKVYDLNECDGFQTRTIKGILKNYECLYLIKNGIRIITLSQDYHKNYVELKAIISEKSKNLGEGNYDVFDEIAEIVTLNF